MNEKISSRQSRERSKRKKRGQALLITNQNKMGGGYMIAGRNVPSEYVREGTRFRTDV